MEVREKSSLLTFSVKSKINTFQTGLNSIWKTITTMLELFQVR